MDHGPWGGQEDVRRGCAGSGGKMGATPGFQPKEVHSLTFKILPPDGSGIKFEIDIKKKNRTGHWPPRQEGSCWSLRKFDITPLLGQSLHTGEELLDNTALRWTVGWEQDLFIQNNPLSGSSFPEERPRFRELRRPPGPHS